MVKEKLLPNILIDFLNHLENIEGKTKTTIDDYTCDLHMFLSYLYLDKRSKKITENTQLTMININKISIKFIQDITVKNIYDFLEYLNQRGNSQSTITRRVMSIKSFYHYLYMVDIIQKDIVADIKTKQAKTEEQAYFNTEEMNKILQALKESNNRNKVRDYSIILMLMTLGLRNSELRNLKLKDIDFNSGKIRILGKGEQIRYTCLNNSLRKSLNNWMEIRKDINIKTGNENYIFISQQGKQINRDVLNRIVKRYVALAGFDSKKYHTHSLRHSAINEMLKTTGNIKLTQQLSGHKSAKTLLDYYAHTTNNELKEAIANVGLGE